MSDGLAGLLPGMGTLEQATGGLAGEGTATTAAFPWVILPIALTLLQTIFKKTATQEAEDLKKQMAVLGLQTPYQSPYMSTVDPVVVKALLAQLGRTSNWGWPAGKQMDTSFIQDALGSIGTGALGGSVNRRVSGIPYGD